jgi:hypothetical protein
MTFLDFLCVSAEPVKKYDESSATFECDYDKNTTSLYQAMESEAWVPTLEFFETGKWSSASLFSTGEDPLPPERQARTWVTRFEPDGTVRWSQLPLHAALIFGAPFKIVATLVALYPQGVRCTDDQHMLPLHLAMKFGTEDNAVRLLLESFPDSLFTKDIRGRLPAQIEGPRQDRTEIIDEAVRATTKTLQKKHHLNLQDELAELKDDLVLQNKLNADMESQKKELDVRYQRTQTEVVILRNEVKELLEQLKSERDTRSRKPNVIVDSPEVKKEKRVRTFVFGRKKEIPATGSSVQHEDDASQESPPTQPTPKNKPDELEVLLSETNPDEKAELEGAQPVATGDEKSDASESESITSTVSKQHKHSAQTKKVPRRGFFKGFGAKELNKE